MEIKTSVNRINEMPHDHQYSGDAGLYPRPKGSESQKGMVIDLVRKEKRYIFPG